jgi:hypothetical protein
MAVTEPWCREATRQSWEPHSVWLTSSHILILESATHIHLLLYSKKLFGGFELMCSILWIFLLKITRNRSVLLAILCTSADCHQECTDIRKFLPWCSRSVPHPYRLATLLFYPMWISSLLFCKIFKELPV